MSKTLCGFLSTIKNIEHALIDFYDFNPIASALDYLITSEELPLILDKENLPNHQRAGVFFSEEKSELFIGIHFTQPIIKTLKNNNPNTILNNHNLDAFSVVVEEISHFHLILDRIKRSQKLSHLELEWQAEIDKLLIAGLYLHKHAGDPHIEALKKILFSRSIVTSTNTRLYQEANFFAEKFWQDFLASIPKRKDCLHSTEFKIFMQKNYKKPLNTKEYFSNKKNILQAA